MCMETAEWSVHILQWRDSMIPVRKFCSVSLTLRFLVSLPPSLCFAMAYYWGLRLRDTEIASEIVCTFPRLALTHETMPPLNCRVTRDIVRQRSRIEGPRSLHRGIHYTLNDDAAKTFRKNEHAPRADHRDLLVHHQKINEDLQDVYARTAALHGENATMEERIEESWRQFERIGGKRPMNVRKNNDNAALCVSRTAIPYADRLATVAKEKKELREKASLERKTRGEIVDYSDGGALHAAKDKRIRNYQRRQLKRAHLLRRMGDPTPLKQSGKYDMASGTLRVFNKTVRQVRREVANDERIAAVRERRPGSRSQWDITDGGNVNRPHSEMLRYSREWELGPHRRKGKKRGRE